MDGSKIYPPLASVDCWSRLRRAQVTWSRSGEVRSALGHLLEVDEEAEVTCGLV